MGIDPMENSFTFEGKGRELDENSFLFIGLGDGIGRSSLGSEMGDLLIP